MHPCVLGGDEAAINQPRLRLGFGDGADDHHLVGVGDHDPLDRVAVVRRTTQHRPPLIDSHDPHQCVRAGGDVTDDGDLVTDHHAAPPELARSHRDDNASVVEKAAVTPAVDGDDASLLRFGVRRTQATTRP